MIELHKQTMHWSKKANNTKTHESRLLCLVSLFSRLQEQRIQLEPLS